ncbi:MAG: VTT domain-containing protein, partial [Bacteroidota bacterium]
LFGVLLSYPLAALIGLYLGKFVFRKTGQDLLKNDRYKKILEQLEKGPLAMLIFARLSPVLPFGMTNILLGQLELKAGMYLLGTMIGMLPRTLFFFFLGTQAQEIIYLLQHPNESSTGQIMTLFFLLISVGGLFWVGMRVWKRSFNS